MYKLHARNQHGLLAGDSLDWHLTNISETHTHTHTHTQHVETQREKREGLLKQKGRRTTSVSRKK